MHFKSQLMEKNIAPRLGEIIYGSSIPSESLRISSLEKQGLIRKIAPRLYTSNLQESPEVIIKRNWFKILAKQYHGALLSHRSALEFRPAMGEHVFLTYTYTKKIKLPGLVIHFIKGPKAIEGDNPFFDSLYVSQQARAFLENLQETRKTADVPKTLSLKEVEEKLEMILRIQNEDALNSLRDTARTIAPELGMKKEFKKLDKIIGALLTTKESSILTSETAKARSSGEPFDPDRITLFEKLYNVLAGEVFPEYSEKNQTQKSYQNFAFFEGYFSNYIEGTKFEVAQALAIVNSQTPLPARDEDSHDILGTYKIVADRSEMSIRPKDTKHFLDILQYRHKTILEVRISKNPGHFKDKNNYAGDTKFVDFELVKGTLKKGFEYYQTLRNPFARAAYMMFFITEVHPFLDGNGRMARIMMNAELTSERQSKIIIPTVYREDYMLALKRLTGQSDPAPYVKMLQRVYEFSKNIFDDDLKAMQKYLIACNAFREPTEAKMKIIGALELNGYKAEEISNASGKRIHLRDIKIPNINLADFHLNYRIVSMTGVVNTSPIHFVVGPYHTNPSSAEINVDVEVPDNCRFYIQLKNESNPHFHGTGRLEYILQ